MKLYSDEPGTEIVQAMEPLVASELARVEVPSAVWRKHRSGDLSVEAAGTLVTEFEEDCMADDGDGPRFSLVALAGQVLDLAARMVAAHDLRAMDSIQLAAAVTARKADQNVSSFVCFDGRLRGAAAAEGFDLVPTRP